MRRGFKGFFSLLAVMVFVLAFNMMAFAAQAPIPPKTPKILDWTDSTITVEAENGWEYAIRGLDGVVSSWNRPSYPDLLAGKYTFKNLKPGMGYNVYARAMETDDRKAWDLSLSDDTWNPAYVVLPLTFEGVVKTPGYPKDLDGYLPAYVYIYDMNSGKEVAALLTEWNGHFKGNANGVIPYGTYKLVAKSSKNNQFSVESTITLPVTSMQEYILTNSPSSVVIPSGTTTNSDTVTVYRLNSDQLQEHLYTTDVNEVLALNGNGVWKYEGIAWSAPKSGTPVYRLYNPVLKQHLYTTDTNEMDVLTKSAGWVKDNNGTPVFYSGGNVDIYRLYAAEISGVRGVHHLTTDKNEYNTLNASTPWYGESVKLKGVAAGNAAAPLPKK